MVAVVVLPPRRANTAPTVNIGGAWLSRNALAQETILLSFSFFILVFSFIIYLFYFFKKKNSVVTINRVTTL